MRSALPPRFYTSTITQLTEFAGSRLSGPRFEHVVRTSLLMRELCDRRQLDSDWGAIAGLGHDLCRESSATELRETAGRDNLPIQEWEIEEPLLLHGRAAAVLLRERFAVTNESILEAVRWHTTGIPGMGELAKLLYIADYIEPGRIHVDNDLRDRVRSVGTDEGVLIILKETTSYLEAAGKPIIAPIAALNGELIKAEQRE